MTKNQIRNYETDSTRKRKGKEKRKREEEEDKKKKKGKMKRRKEKWRGWEKSNIQDHRTVVCWHLGLVAGLEERPSGSLSDSSTSVDKQLPSTEEPGLV